MEILFLVNPVSGSMVGESIASLIEQSNSIQGISKQVVFTDSDRLENQILSLIPGRDLVVICGGDGTISKISSIFAMIDSPPPMAVIPVGTGNDIARASGWYKIWKEGGLDFFWAGVLTGRLIPWDLWYFEGAGFFMGYAGIGIDAAIVKKINKIRESFGFFSLSRYLLNIIYLLAGIPVFSRAVLPGKGLRGYLDFTTSNQMPTKGDYSFVQLLFSNIPSYSGGSRLVAGFEGKTKDIKQVKMDDGLIEFYSMQNISKFMHLLLRRFPSLFRPILPDSQSEEIVFYLDKSAPLQLDGEWIMELKARKPYRIYRKRALPFLIPPENMAVKEMTGLKIEQLPAFLERVPSAVTGSAANSKNC